MGVDAAIESDDRRLPSRAGRIRPPLVNNTRTAMAPTTILPVARRLLPIAVAALLAACGSAPTKSPSTGAAGAAPQASPSTRYYKDDGPGDNPPPNLDGIPEAVPKAEPLHRFANRPYTVLGRDYTPATSLRPYRERGVASWYGKKFHGEKTSTGETYDMYAMTAAHPTLPLPSYARVTNVATGKSVVVRVNDRGPFLHNRVIDLSYAAADRIGIAQKGSGEVEVEAILPSSTPTVLASAPLPPVSPPENVAPPASPAASEPAPTVPVASLDGGYVVQLGAFASYANAQNFVAHVSNQIAPLGVEPGVRQVNGLFRVYLGPYPARDDAKRMADRLRDALGMASTIAVH
jgi:rare lipoprotein A